MNHPAGMFRLLRVQTVSGGCYCWRCPAQSRKAKRCPVPAYFRWLSRVHLPNTTGPERAAEAGHSGHANGGTGSLPFRCLECSGQVTPHPAKDAGLCGDPGRVVLFAGIEEASVPAAMKCCFLERCRTVFGWNSGTTCDLNSCLSAGPHTADQAEGHGDHSFQKLLTFDASVDRKAS